MINLISTEEKKRKKRDFYLRVIIVFFLVLGFCVLVASVSILPSYFLSSVNKNLANTKLETQKKEPTLLADQDSLVTMEDLNNKLNLVENAEKNKYLISQKVINEIIFKKMSDIKITQVSYEANLPSGKKISVHGIAPSREKLLLFRRALEDSLAFEKVDLPISNFVRGSNIEFYLNLIPRLNIDAVE
jgi:cell division protein FtsI/penicillin-binding protein 2